MLFGVEGLQVIDAEPGAEGTVGNLVLVGDIGAKALGGAVIVTDGAAEGSNLVIAGPAIDRDGETVTRQAPRGHRSRPNGVALGDLPGVEQVELDFPHDVGDAGLAWFPGGEVTGFF